MSILPQRRMAPRHLAFWSVLLASAATVPVSIAGPLVPMTRVKLTVVQFVASSGEYKSWDALGGEFDVAPDGTIDVPSLGAIPVGEFSADQLAGDIADRLQRQLGLIEKPDATVQVVRYPPIYVVGNVAAPGQFDYRPGMSLLQALALAGGEPGADGAIGETDTIRLETELAGYGSDILRLQARLARLDAEFSKATEITFPTLLDAADPAIARILEQERRIFVAHGNELTRQRIALFNLEALYNAEIDALGQKLEAVEGQTASAEQQVAAIKDLLASGSATAARLSEVERALADLRSQRLDIIIATMTARENLSHSQRELAKIEDEQQSEAARLLQENQANLEKLVLQQGAARQMLVKAEEIDHNAILAQQIKMVPSYTILRQDNGEMVSLPATEITLLQPGDLVKVTRVEGKPNGAPVDTALADAQ